MDIECLRNICLGIKGASESLPFDENTLVFKVMNKMFAYINLAPKDDLLRVNLKCNAERTIELREKYNGIVQCVHTKSLMWNSVYIDSDVPDDLIVELINHSVDEVIKGLSKNKQIEYNNL